MIESKHQLAMLNKMRNLADADGMIYVAKIKEAHPELFSTAWTANSSYNVIRALLRKKFIQCKAKGRYRIVPVSELPEPKPVAKTAIERGQWDADFARHWLSRPWRECA